MGDFADSPKWKLINDFTIHEDRNLKDRPFMHTCVPKTLDVEVTAFEIVRSIEWPSNYGEVAPDGHAECSYIRFSGELHDRIIVFSMSDGEIETFQTLADARIRSLPAGKIGGKNKATSMDGIHYSIVSSHDVPREGLMEGEPSVLTYLSELEEQHGEKKPASMTATLFLDEDTFSRLLTMLSTNPRPVRTFKLSILAELFESELSASLSGPWMSRDYGLLMKGTAMANTRARIELLSLSAGTTTLGAEPDDGGGDDRSILDRLLGIKDRTAAESIPDYSRAVLKYQRYILMALLLLIVVTAYSN